MFAKLKTEKLGASSAQNSPSPQITSAKSSSVTSSVDASADERDSLRGESDGEVQPKESKSTSAAKDVAFLQARLQDLMGKLKLLKKEKEAAEANANYARQRHLEREEEILREQQKKQNEMQESFHLSLKQKEAEKQALQKKMDESEKLREKIMLRDVESDELKDFQNQELGKVKHMLILAENQVSKLETELAATSTSLAREGQRVEELERNLRDTQESLHLKTAQLRSLEDKSTSDTAAFTSTLKEIRSEKSAAQTENQNLGEMLNQKVAAYSALEEKLACLEEDYARDKRAAEIYRREAEANKISSSDERSQMVEKIQGLENRLSSADLGDDDKFKALEKDRQTLERRLIESREQLTEIKTSWSSKIEALEAQISHLNLKQDESTLLKESVPKVDDNADLAAKELEVEEQRNRFTAQLTDYQSRLRDAETRLAQTTSNLEDQKLKFERKLALKDVEAEHLRSEAQRLESEAQRLESEASIADETAKELREEIEKLETRVAELTKEAESLKTEVESAMNGAELARKEAEVSKREAEGLGASLAAAESSLLEAELAAEEKVQENRASKEEEEERWKIEKESYESKIRELETKFEEDAKTLRDELEAMTKLKESLESEVKVSNSDGEDRRKRVEALERKLEEEAENLAALEKEKERWTLEKEMMVERERELSALSSSRSQKRDISTSPVKKTRQEEEEEEELTKLRESQRTTAADLLLERKEKDALLLRNAELSQNVNSLKSQLAAANEASVAASAANASSNTCSDPADQSSSSSSQQQQSTGETNSTEDDYSDSSSPEEMTKIISDLKSQLTERNKTVKLQQQRIGDLRKTIQRELKLQSVGGGGGLSAPGMNYGSSTEDLPSLCAEGSSPFSPPQNHASTSSSSSLIPHLDAPENGTAYPLSASLTPAPVVPFSITSNGVTSSSSAAVLPDSSPALSVIPSSSFLSSPIFSYAGSSDVDDVIFPAVSPSSGPSVVSFRYLKHVIIRFMISSEYEAQHLVKAVSTLLRFDKEEEKLVTDHLNYKVSWFGSKPSLKKLKSAKVRDVI